MSILARLSIRHRISAIGAGELHRLNFVDVFGNH
jgi:hypothetical protein